MVLWEMLPGVIHIKRHRKHMHTRFLFTEAQLFKNAGIHTILKIITIILYYRHAQLHTPEQKEEAGPKPGFVNNSTVSQRLQSNESLTT